MSNEQYTPPKYFQISRTIIAMIQRGELPPGSPVPSENDIIAKYQVSNTTARKVLHELESGNWVTRVKGKGTYVRDYAVVRAINRIFGFTKNMLEAGRKPATRLLGFHLRDEDHTQTINGREFTLKGPFCEIDRLRLADGIPMMKETRYISLSLCPDIHQRNLEQSLYELFSQDYGIHLTEINQMLSAVLLEGTALKAFGLTKPVPAFRVEGASFCGKGIIVEMEDSVYRGDMYRFAAKAVMDSSVPGRGEKK
ncbi:MAG TPA: GntR family transcriptional regulator [Candidatus Sulfotelmatobacter sp.]|nr:GntR family transcriptional regulator [Candidatus Sulfotelmatobacter sp.]HWI56570.1 GntR family transcriptional regulator [Bacillota bacterium]